MGGKRRLTKQTERVQTFANIDPLVFLMENTPHLAEEARRAKRDLAASWRGVNVGSVAVVNNAERDTGDCFLGFNYTPYKGAEKYCAEMRAFGRAKKHGHLHRDAVIVAGPSNPAIIKSITGFEASTLPPCEPCSMGFLEDSTVVVTISDEDHPDKNVYQLYTGARLKKIYEEEAKLTNKQRARRIPEEPTPVIYDPGFLAISGAASAYLEITQGIEYQAETDQQERMFRANAAIEAIYGQADHLGLVAR